MKKFIVRRYNCRSEFEEGLNNQFKEGYVLVSWNLSTADIHVAVFAHDPRLKEE